MRGYDRIKRQISIILKRPMFYFCLFFIVINLAFTKQILDSNGVGGFAGVAVVEVFVELCSIIAVYRMKKRGVPIEKIFLFIALLLGIMFIAILPPGQSPDEVTHFQRAYSISDGIFVPGEVEGTGGRVGNEIPIGTDFLLREPMHGTYLEIVDRIDDDTEEKKPQVYTSAALYSFICYIPQIIGALIGKLLGFSVLGISYLMEIFNFIVWVFLVYYAIKFIPKFKSVVLFVALLPITLQEATSLSPDALTIGLSIFFISYIIYLAYGRKKELKKGDYIILSACSLLIGFCKIVYLPLILLLLLIPEAKFKTKRRRWLFLGILFVFVAAVNLAWLAFSSRYLIEYKSGVNSKEQLMGIIGNPFRYLMVMFRSACVHSQLWLSNMLGMSLGSFKFNLPSVLFVQKSESLVYKKADRWIILFVFLAIFVLILTSLYMQWTPYGEDLIDGVQGRYYLPILMLVPLIVCPTRSGKKPLAMVSEDLIVYNIVFINMVALVTIFAQNA